MLFVIKDHLFINYYQAEWKRELFRQKSRLEKTAWQVYKHLSRQSKHLELSCKRLSNIVEEFGNKHV